MTKQTVICPSCENDNEPETEFCTNCGLQLSKANNKEENLSPKNKAQKEYRNWLASLPYIFATMIFLIFLDLVTSGWRIRWSYWAVVPLLLFAVIAPYFSYKLNTDLQSTKE